jgi:cytoskeletal protein RodZ
VADQRYCLACGQPVSPVRLAFLDVLQSERQQQSAPGALTTTPVAYGPLLEPSGSPAWLRRYTPLFAVMSVLLLALIVGLLVGHWVTQSKSSAPTQQVIKVEGLSAAPAAAATSTAPTSSSATPAASSPSAAAKSSPKSEAEEVATEAKAEKQQAAKVEHAAVVKPSSTKLKKLGNSTGKKHEEEVNALGEQPIETGG